MEGHRVAALGLGRELQVHLEEAVGTAAGVHFDADVDLRLQTLAVGPERFRRQRVLEGQIADELGENAEAGLRDIAVGSGGGGRVAHEEIVFLDVNRTGARR